MVESGHLVLAFWVMLGQQDRSQEPQTTDYQYHDFLSNEIEDGKNALDFLQHLLLQIRSSTMQLLYRGREII
jgi:hypothetical protein